MKRIFPGLAVGLMAAAGLQAQVNSAASAPIVPTPPGAASDAAVAAASSSEVAPATTFTDAQLRQMLGSIALYPDALIALILTSATEPSDVVLAARFLPTKPTEAQIDAQPWSESVRALARYPDVITWMDANLAWTRQVGGAFLVQPADMMNAVQGLRAQARAVGTLADTPEQRVVVEEQTIRIEPATNVIYVPYYDPAIVYVRRPLGLRSSYFRFSSGYTSTVWYSYDFDWHRRTVIVVNGGYPNRPHNHYPQPPRPGHGPRPGYPAGNYHPWTPPTPRPRVYQPAPRGDQPGRRPSQTVPGPGVPPRPLNPLPPSRSDFVPNGPRTPVPGQRFQAPQNQFVPPSQSVPRQTPAPNQPASPLVRPGQDSGWSRPQGPRVSPPARVQQGGVQPTRPQNIFGNGQTNRPAPVLRQPTPGAAVQSSNTTVTSDGQVLEQTTTPPRRTR